MSSCPTLPQLHRRVYGDGDGRETGVQADDDDDENRNIFQFRNRLNAIVFVLYLDFIAFVKSSLGPCNFKIYITFHKFQVSLKTSSDHNQFYL